MEAHNQLNYIINGMDVFDVNGKRIGSVEYIYHGKDTTLTDNPNIETLQAEMHEALGGTKDFPYPVYSRLYHYGFIRVGRNFFQSDIFVVPQQIDDIEEASVYLNAATDALLKG
jgi:hypothetical protein